MADVALLSPPAQASVPKAQTPGVDDPKVYLDRITKDYKRLQQQKARVEGGIEGRCLLNLSMGLASEHYKVLSNRQLLSEVLDPNKLHLVFNLTGQRAEKLIGRLCAVGGTYKASPSRRDPKAFNDAEVVDRMIKALDEKVDQPSRTREIMFWLLYGGTAFEVIRWDKAASIEPMPQYTPATPENTQGELLYTDLLNSNSAEPSVLPQSQALQQVEEGRPPETFKVNEDIQEAGDVVSEVYGPLNVFIDQGVKSIGDLGPGQAVYTACFKTWDWIEDNYPGATTGLAADRDMAIVTTRFDTQQDASASVAGMSLKDLIPVVQGSRTEDDPPMNVVVERYEAASKKQPHGRFTCFIPQKKVLYDGDLPYGEVTIVDYHFKPVTTSFWTKDYITDLIAPNRFLNKRMSQLGEHANSSIYDKILLGPGLTEKDIPADWPGVVKNGLGEKGELLVQRLPGPQLPGWFLESINVTLKMFNDLAGGTDLLSEHNFPGQLRGPMAVPMLQEIIDTQWGPFYEHLGQRMAKAKQMRLNLVKQFYPPTRTMHYMDRNQQDAVFEFHKEEILRSGTDYNITVERGSLMPELRALREARVRERLASPLSILYIDERTGRLDKSKIAQDLAVGDVGRDSAEAQYRKLGGEIVAMLWEGKPLPPVLPFYNHGVMMDELESAMATTEFLHSTPPIQQGFFQRWQQHMTFLQQAAQQQAQAQQQQSIDQAVAQATQQAAATAAAEAVHAGMGALHAQVEQASGVPNMLQSAFQKEQA